MTPNTPSHNEEVEKIVELFIKDFCLNGKIRPSMDKVEYLSNFIRINFSTLRHSIESEVRGSTIESVRAMVINELRQQRMEGFSLDGTDFNAVFDSVKKTITTPVKPLQD
jgi:hypothetical protein